MYYSITGKIIETALNYVALENSGIAYLILMSQTGDVHVGDTITLYIHQVIKEDEIYLVGFLSKLDKDIFLKLITVKGIGPKTALMMLSATNHQQLSLAISAGNVAYLKKLPGIGPKAASQIILDLKGQLNLSDSKIISPSYSETKDGLKQLGFKVKEIDEVLASINQPELSSEQLIKLALNKLAKL